MVIKCFICSSSFSHNQRAIQSIGLMMSSMGMIQKRSFLSCMKNIPEFSSIRHGTLSNERNSVTVRCFMLCKAMPMDCRRRSFHLIIDIHNDYVISTDLNVWSRQLPIDGHKCPFRSIASHTLLTEAVCVIELDAFIASTAESLVEFESEFEMADFVVVWLAWSATFLARNGMF